MLQIPVGCCFVFHFIDYEKNMFTKSVLGLSLSSLFLVFIAWKIRNILLSSMYDAYIIEVFVSLS